MPEQPKRLKQHLLFCFFSFFFGTTSFAQTTKVDELLGQLNKSNHDTVQIQILRKLSMAYTSVDPLKKFFYANQYRLLAEKNGIDSLVSTAYIDMGISYGVRSKLDSALYYFDKGFAIAKKINYTINIAKSHANIGFAYDHLERKKEAVAHYEEALKIYRKLNIKRAINQSITNLGAIYSDLGMYKVADGYFLQVLENVREVPSDQIGLANALFSLGNSNRMLNNPIVSLSYYQKSLAIREKLGDLNGIALSNWGMAELAIQKKNYSEALAPLEIALKNDRILKNSYNESVVLNTFSKAYLGLKDYLRAEETANLALLRAKESGSKSLTAQALAQLATVNSVQKKFAEALRFQTAYLAMTDSLNTRQTKKDVITTDLNRINTDNKILTRDNKTITSKNSDYATVISIITGLLIVVIVLLALYYKRNQEKKITNVILQTQKQEIADVNEELGSLNEELIAQMDIVSAQNIELEKLNKVKNKFFSIVSHDLRGPLITLKSLFEFYRSGDLDQKELTDLLVKLEDKIHITATFLDNLLEWSKSQFDGMVVTPSIVSVSQIVDENMKLMDSQIKLKALKVVNEIQDKATVFADPNMINIVFRNLLSNAIKFCNIGDAVTFNAKLDQGNAVYTISDTGPGISDKDQVNLFSLAHNTSTGTAGEKGYHMGLILCKDMIVQNNGTIQVTSNLGDGTTFQITLPTKDTV